MREPTPLAGNVASDSHLYGTRYPLQAQPGPPLCPRLDLSVTPLYQRPTAAVPARAGDGRRLMRIYIIADTLVHPRLREIPVRFPDIDLALLHLGGARILGLLVTMDAKQGTEMIKIVNPAMVVPIHFNDDDYTVYKFPLEDFGRAVQAAGLEKRVSYVSHGQIHTFHARPSA